jgi:hypothetical protein
MASKAIFLGASNTFGCGLHLFSGAYDSVDRIKSLDKSSIASPVTEADKEFIRTHRWSSKIAKYLGREEVNVSRAGGSPAETLNILQQSDLSDVDYVFIEFSNIYSFYDRYFFDHETAGNPMPRTPGEVEEFLTNGKRDRPELRERITQWVLKFNPKEFNDEIMLLFEQALNGPLLKDKKVVVIWWKPHIFDNVVFDPDHYTFLKKYAVRFPFPGGENNYSAHNMILNTNLTVYQEHPHGAHLAFPDDHASPRGSDLVADIIINHINEKNSTNSW